MHRNLLSLTILLVLLNAAPVAQPSHGTPGIGKRLHKADSIRQRFDIPALGYAIVTADSIVDQQVIGFRKLEDGNPTSPATLDDYFHLGSNGKAITGMVAGWLVEQGKISWDTRLFDLFPEMKAASHKRYGKATLQDLLSHRARIQPYTGGGEFQDLPEFSGSTQQQRSAFCGFVLQQKPVKGGLLKKKKFSYSNAGYSLAAMMLEKAGGRSWEQLVTDLLEGEMGLNPVFGWPNVHDSATCWGHYEEEGKLCALAPEDDYNLKLAEPAGDISLTLPDYAKLIQYNLQGLAGKNNVLKAETYRFLHLGRQDYAIGWNNFTNSKGQVFSQHSGSAGTFYADAWIFHSQNAAIIVLANAGGAKAANGVDWLVYALTGAK